MGYKYISIIHGKKEEIDILSIGSGYCFRKIKIPAAASGE